MLFTVPRRSIRGLLMGGLKYRSALSSVFSPPQLLRHHLFHLRTSIRCPPEVNHLFFCLKSSRFVYNVARPSTAAHAAVEGDEVAKPVDCLTSKLGAIGIDSRGYKPGQQVRQLCPECTGGSSAEKSLSFLVHKDGDSAVWLCFRATCGWRGYIRVDGDGNTTCVSKNENLRVITESDLQLEPLCEELISYFSERNISVETLRRNSVMQCKDDDEIIIAFCYKRKGALVSCSYRTVSKNIWQELGTESIFYGLDDINQASDVIIVQSEIDKLSMEQAGYLNCVSIPCGETEQICNGLPDQDTKFRYLWNCNEFLENASRIILATDADTSGQAIAEELARRLGKERCWRVEWPKKNGAEVYKDANEVLMYLGPDSLRKVVENAELYPIKGLFKFRDFVHEIDEYYNQRSIEHLGVSTGWKTLDGLYNVVPGELTLITGVPNSGKSEWIDALLCNINECHGWKFVLCSMENKVEEHARKLLEKHIKKPFFNASYGGSTDRMNVEELEEGKKWLNDTFYLIRCEDDCLPSVTWVLQLAKHAVLRYGVRGLVIDPYNELDHQRRTFQTETEYVSQMLTRIKRFAEHHSCHVWFVAHPRQLHDWDGRAPNLYDISGSAHFVNKCDNGIVIHRDRNLVTGLGVEVYVRKVRNKVAGTVGVASLSYNRITGVFNDKDQDCSETAATSSEQKLERSPCTGIVKQGKKMTPSS